MVGRWLAVQGFCVSVLLASACTSGANPIDPTVRAQSNSTAAQATLISAAKYGLPPRETTAAHKTLVADATAGLVPKGIVIATATPDLRDVLTVEKASEFLRRAPSLDALLSAIGAGDVDRFLGLIEKQPTPCGGRADDGCRPGVPTGMLVPKNDVVDGDSFYVSDDTLRPSLEVLLPGKPLALQFAAQSRINPMQYLIGLSGGPKGNALAPLGDPSEQLTSILLDVDAAKVQPVQWLTLGSGRGTAPAGNDFFGSIRYMAGDWRILLFVGDQ